MARRALVKKLFACLAVALAATHANAQFIMTRGDLESQFRVQWLQIKRNNPQDTRPGVQRYAQCVANDIIAPASR